LTLISLVRILTSKKSEVLLIFAEIRGQNVLFLPAEAARVHAKMSARDAGLYHPENVE